MTCFHIDCVSLRLSLCIRVCVRLLVCVCLPWASRVVQREVVLVMLTRWDSALVVSAKRKNVVVDDVESYYSPIIFALSPR